MLEVIRWLQDASPNISLSLSPSSAEGSSKDHRYLGRDVIARIIRMIYSSDGRRLDTMVCADAWWEATDRRPPGRSLVLERKASYTFKVRIRLKV